MPVPHLGSPRCCTRMSWASFPSLPVLSSLLNRSSHGGHGSSPCSAPATCRWPRDEDAAMKARDQTNNNVLITRLTWNRGAMALESTRGIALMDCQAASGRKEEAEALLPMVWG